MEDSELRPVPSDATTAFSFWGDILDPSKHSFLSHSLYQATIPKVPTLPFRVCELWATLA